MPDTLSRAFAFSLAAHVAAAGGWLVFGPVGTGERPLPGRVEVRWEEVPAPEPVAILPVEPAPPTVLEPPASTVLPVTVAEDAEDPRPSSDAIGISSLGTRLAEEAALLGAGPRRVRPAPAPPPAEAEPEPPRPEPGPSRSARPLAGRCDPPEYPSDARSRGRSGVVHLEVDVDADGRVEAVRVVESSGTRSLDRAAVRAISRWKFSPALRDGRAVSSTLHVPVRFSLSRVPR